jgi:hypothetical protein
MLFSFDCRHKSTSFPITLPRNAGQFDLPKRTYIVCFDCGREIPYSWDKMRVMKRREQQSAELEAQYEPAVSA